MMTLNSAIPILPAGRLEESMAFYQRLGFTSHNLLRFGEAASNG